MTINVTKAKTNLSKLIKLLESGQEREIIVCKWGKPILRWTLFSETTRPFGMLKNEYPQNDSDFFSLDGEIASEFGEV